MGRRKEERTMGERWGSSPPSTTPEKLEDCGGGAAGSIQLSVGHFWPKWEKNWRE